LNFAKHIKYYEKLQNSDAEICYIVRRRRFASRDSEPSFWLFFRYRSTCTHCWLAY